MDDDAYSALLRASAARDREGVGAAVARLSSQLQQVAVRTAARMGSTEAEDVSQEVLQRLIANPPSNAGEHPRATVFAWVKRTAANLVVSRARRGPAAIELDDAMAADSQLNPERFLAAREELLRLRRCVEQRYPRGLPLLELYLTGQDRTPGEFAAELGTSVENIYQMLSRIRRALAGFEEDE